MTQLISRAQAEEWAGRPLSDKQFLRLCRAVADSPIKGIIFTLAENLVDQDAILHTLTDGMEQLAAMARKPTTTIEDFREVADKVTEAWQDLDEWITAGRPLPEEWQRNRP